MFQRVYINQNNLKIGDNRMDIERRLEELNIQIPDMPKPIASYVPFVKTNHYVYISGQGPSVNGENKYTGKVGKDITVEEGYDAAKLTVLNVLAILTEAAGGLDNVERIISLRGYVNSDDDFYDQPFVINGASELLIKIFGEKGQHARSAVSVNSLPMNISVEIELIAETKI